MELKKIKLNALSKSTMVDKAMNALKGGDCSCYWEGRDGSSSNDNMNANSQHGCNLYHNYDYNDGGWVEEAHA